MTITKSRRLLLWLPTAALCALASYAYASGVDPILGHLTQLPNNTPVFNGAGFSATYSTRGFVDFTTQFHVPQGTNGRHCGTCHVPGASWSIRPIDAKLLFTMTGGTHPLFRTPEANNPLAKVDTVAARRVAYSMLLNKAVFRRSFPVPSGAEFAVIAIDDPYGVATPTSLSTFRRPLVSTNLPLINGVAWENRTGAANGDPHVGLISQARGNVTGAQQGSAPSTAVLEDIVSWETSLFTAQLSLHDGGRLDACGARGGPEHLSQQPRVSGRFDLFDAWIGLVPGSCTNPKEDPRRAQIARGQELFNEARSANGGTCRDCHNVANNGTNFNGTLFDVGASAASRRTPDMPLYTLRRLGVTGTEVVQTTDPGRALISGHWSDINRFKTPTLRGLASRAPYFHNGIATSLHDVVRLYEASFGFNFTPEEAADLVAFLSAL